MKYLLIYISLCAFSLSLTAQTTVYYDKEGNRVATLGEAQTYEMLFYDKTDTNKVTVKGYQKSGQISYEHNYSNLTKKILNGRTLEWDENGLLSLNAAYEKGKLHGRFYTFWKNGKVRRLDLYHYGDVIAGKCFTREGKDTTYFAYRIMPEFPGGDKALHHYLRSNIHYSDSCKVNGIKGEVQLSFVVNTDSTISSIAITKSAHPALDAEAIRVVKAMPKWEPALIDGEITRFTYNLPIHFGLKTDTTFYDYRGYRVSTLARAETYRISIRNLLDSNRVTVKNYQQPNQLLSIENYSDYEDNTFDGRQIYWYSNGQPSKEAEYKEGQLNGHFLTYWINGQIKRNDLYEKDSLLEGKCYDPEGIEVPYYDYIIEPEFPGGKEALKLFISSNIKYPASCDRDGIQGEVVLTFLIDPNGLITTIVVVGSVHPDLDAEAMRIIKKMPQWSPAFIDGHVTSYEYTLPVIFRLE
jgi:TonB family protein